MLVLCMCPHTTTSVVILLGVCAHTATCVLRLAYFVFACDLTHEYAT